MDNIDKGINSILAVAEECYGIKVDPDDAQRLHLQLCKKYGSLNAQIIKNAFLSGEAAGFLTVNETYFFRESAHFFLLRDYLHSLGEGGRGGRGAAGGIRICCAAVASGCEAYSIAMLLNDFNKNCEKPVPFHIDAFDINRQALEIASKGLYSERALREDGSCFHYMAAPFLKKIEGGYRPEYLADASIRKNISFFAHNLMDELPGKDYDVIFFRNAFIYITAKNRPRILSNLHAALKEGGLLITGVSETAAVASAIAAAIASAACLPGLEGKNKGDVFYFQKNTSLSSADGGFV
ncbi:MAG: hypothetical protein FWG66_14425 [Spirochaetes bacterium]|nr:hypothetical protein [Spirochaetota bacterium]